MDLIGRQIGSYVVERELGAGGTGTVYLCSHTMIDRKVAVKVLHDELAYQPDQVARFFQEAKAAADIGHPNIVVIIDFGSIPVPGGSRSYLMMECLDGSSLDKRLRKGERFTLEQIAHILEQICSALAASHGKGIIHRDLKPANVQMCPRSFDPYFVKLLDFGIAKLATPSPDARRTQLGVVIGTPAYMSPEQCEGKGVLDHRSDIYSLGVMLYELLTGTLPFEGEIRDILMGHLTGKPPSVRERNPEIPPEWEALCMHMMEKSRDARFQSVSEIAQALYDLPRHATAYASYVNARASQGRSGNTMRLETSPDPQEAPMRPTLQVAVDLPPLATPPLATGAYATGAPGTAAPGTPQTGTFPPELPPVDPNFRPQTGVFRPQTGAFQPLEHLNQADQATPAVGWPAGSGSGLGAGSPAEPGTGAAWGTGPATGKQPGSESGAAPTPASTSGTAWPSASGSGTAPATVPASPSGSGTSSGSSWSPVPRPVVDAVKDHPTTSTSSGFGDWGAAMAQAGQQAWEGPPTGDTGAGMAACYALATEARHSRFLATLLLRPPGRWSAVTELCSASLTAPPAALPPQPLFCTWLEHPWADPAMVAVIFVSLADGSNTVALCRRVAW